MIVEFPAPAARQPHPYRPLQAEIERVEHWLELAQRTLSRIPVAEVEDHRRLRALADELIARLLDDAAA